MRRASRRGARAHSGRAALRLLLALACASALTLACEPDEPASDPDLNDDGIVDIEDVSIVASCWGQDPAVCDPRSDTNGDGVVDDSDIDYVTSHWGESGFPTGGPDTTPPVVSIESPEHLAVFGSSPIGVTGVVDDTSASVSVNGVAAVVDPDGTFRADGVALSEGTNTLLVLAVDPAGNQGQASIQVDLDTQPPQIAISSPADRSSTGRALLEVAGTISDNGVTTVGGDQVRVTVSSPVHQAEAKVIDGSFSASDLVLGSGSNLITVEASDSAGNGVVQQITVFFWPPSPPSGTSSLRLLTYNTAFLSADIVIAPSPLNPLPIEFTYEPNDGHFSGLGYLDRAEKIAQGILRGDQDIVVLNEVFSDDAKAVLVTLLKGAYPHYIEKLAADPVGQINSFADLLMMLSGSTEIPPGSPIPQLPGTLDASVLPGDSGLMLFSRFRFLPLTGPHPPNDAASGCADCEFAGWNDGAPLAPGDFAFHTYTECAEMDCFASKGLGLVKLETPDRPSYVAFTHLQADEPSFNRAPREVQYQQMEQALLDSAPESELVAVPVYLAGDLNTPGSNKVDFPPLEEWAHIYHPTTSGDKFFACGNDGPCLLHFTGGDGELLTDSWGFETSPDDIGLSQIEDHARFDYVLHNSADDTLCMQHIAIAWDVAESGSVWYSDHLPVRADFNTKALQCSPNEDAAPAYRPRKVEFPATSCSTDPSAPPADQCDPDKSFPGTITHPGSFQWFEITQPGSYSIKVTPAVANEKMAYDVYGKDDLSRPLAPFEDEEDPRWGAPFSMLDPPYYIRVYAVDNSSPYPKPDRTASGRDYHIHFHQHLCRSAQDACFLPPGAVPHPVKWPAITPLSPVEDMWFKFKTAGVQQGQLHPVADSHPTIKLQQEVAIATDLTTNGCIQPLTLEEYDTSDPPQLVQQIPLGPKEVDPDDHDWDDDSFVDERYGAPDLDTDTPGELKAYYAVMHRPAGFGCNGIIAGWIDFETTLSYFLPGHLYNYSNISEVAIYRFYFDPPSIPWDGTIIHDCEAPGSCFAAEGEVADVDTGLPIPFTRGYFAQRLVPGVVGVDIVSGNPFVMKKWGGGLISIDTLDPRSENNKLLPVPPDFLYSNGPNGDEAAYYLITHYVLCHEEANCTY